MSGKPSKQEALRALQAAPVGTKFAADYGWSITKVQAANKEVSYRYEYINPKTGLATRQAQFVKDPNKLAGDVATIPAGLEKTKSTTPTNSRSTSSSARASANRNSGAKQKSDKQETDDLKNPNFRKATDFDPKNNPFNKNNTENRQFELNRLKGNSFNIDRFRAEVVGNDDVLTTHSYLVVFSPMPWVPERATRDGIDSRLTMRCDNAILPTVSLLQEQNIRRYGFGPVENVAYGVNVGDFTLQFIVDKRGTIVDFFEAWMNRIVNRDSFGGANMNNALRDGKRPYEVAYKDTYVCPSVNVFVYDRAQNTVMEYNIYDVFPTGIQSMNLSWGEENSLMKLNVTFSFTDLRIHPKFSNFDNQQIVPVADTLQNAPITVATMGDKPLVDQLTSVNVPADLANQPFVLGEGTNGALRSFGTPGDTPAADDGGATGSSDVRASTRRTPLGPPY